MQKKDDEQIRREFVLRRDRQLLAIAIGLILVVFLAMLPNRPDLMGDFSKSALVGAQIAIIAAFAAFSAFNWRCPSCNKYLGGNINRYKCHKCGTRLR